MQATDLGVALPPLCSCHSGASPFDPQYTSKCTRNCGLFGRPDLHQQLLTRLLQTEGVI